FPLRFSLHLRTYLLFFLIFFFTSPATSEIYTLSLHDALPILWLEQIEHDDWHFVIHTQRERRGIHHLQLLLQRIKVADLREAFGDRKSTRLNSSHVKISYAVFCLKKKIKKKKK